MNDCQVRPRLPHGESPRSDFSNILIVRLSSIGDVVFALPALEILRAFYPRARISWIVEDRSASIIEDHPWLDEVIVMPRRKWRQSRQRAGGYIEMIGEMKRFFRDLRKRKFDLSLDFQGNLKSGAVSFLSGAPVRLGLSRHQCKEPNFLFTTRRLEVADWVMHRCERDLRLLSLLDLPYTFRWPHLHIPPKDRGEIDCFFDSLPKDKRPIAILHPGTSAWGPHKRWPIEHFARLGDGLVQTLGARVILNWGPGEERLVSDIAAAMREPSFRAPPTPNMRQVGYLLSRADIVIGSDTGPTHLAAMQRVPTIVLFGPYDPRYYYPYHHADRAHFERLPCSPCRHRGCTTSECMRRITPDSVLSTCLTALRKTTTSGDALAPKKVVPL